MPLYKCEYLEVTCLERKRFRLDQMREAVEYLKKQQPQSEWVGLTAVTHYDSKEYTFRLGAKPMLTLDQIFGRTRKELWELYDTEVTQKIKYFEGRMSR